LLQADLEACAVECPPNPFPLLKIALARYIDWQTPRLAHQTIAARKHTSSILLILCKRMAKTP
jgi:hypothetical protein